MLLRFLLKSHQKVAITTNYAIKGKGNSFERRKVGARAKSIL